MWKRGKGRGTSPGHIPEAWKCQGPGCAAGKHSRQRDHHTPPRPSLMPQVSGREQNEKTEPFVQKWIGHMQAEVGLPKHDTSPGGVWKKAGWSRLSYSSSLSPPPRARPWPSTNPTSVLLPCPSGTHCPPSLEFSGSPGARPHSCLHLHRATLVARSETPLLLPPGKQRDFPLRPYSLRKLPPRG